MGVSHYFAIVPLQFFLQSASLSVFLCRKAFPVAREFALGPKEENTVIDIKCSTLKQNPTTFEGRLLSTGLNEGIELP